MDINRLNVTANAQLKVMNGKRLHPHIHLANPSLLILLKKS